MVVTLLAVGLLHVDSRAIAPSALLTAGPHHTRHAALLGRGLPRPNRAVLEGVDAVQRTAPAGGGYFVGVKAVPAESPVGYRLSLGGQPLLEPARTTSYCSGSSYGALVEALGRLVRRRPSPERLEAMRMQEPDGGRREDRVKVWGWWNADGFGSEYALVQLTGMGERIRPEAAIPGDFMNISWKSGLGHSVVFLGWCHDAQGRPAVAYWSSQKGTNGYGDQVSALDTIVNVCAVRLTHPERLLTFDPAAPVDPKVPGDSVADLDF